MHKAVILDWGGVLMRTVDYEPRRRWDRQLGLPQGAVEAVVHGSEAWKQAQQGKLTPDEYWSAVGQQLGLSLAQLASLRHDFYSGDRLDAALLSLIADLRARSVLLGLLSNNSLELIDTLADQLPPDKLFDGIIISAQIGVMKPDPGAYRAILDLLDVTASQALFIDDSQENIEGALALGMAAIRFEPGMRLAAAIDSWLSRSSSTPAADFAT